MANTCLDTNLLAYSGTSQLQRMLKALASTYAQVDERTAADFILFAKNYAAYLNYFDANNNNTGNWQPFMNNDPAVVIATVADLHTKDFIPYVEYVTSTLQQTTNIADAQSIFKTLFDLVFTLATQLDNSLNNLTNDIPFRNFLSVSIASNLALPLNILWWYYSDSNNNNNFKNFKALGINIVNENIDYVDPQMPVDEIIFSENFQLSNLHCDSWQIVSFSAPIITLDASQDVIPNINIIITHNLFTGALQSFLNGVIKVISDAPKYLNDVLENYALHQPHYALYLTFTRLFQFAQKKLNNYTQEHLDFYYKDILRLNNASTIPDFVHLLFDLQKNVSDHLLTKGTTFKAGKDASNNELFYALNDDVVLHKANVQSLKSLFLNKSGNGILYAAPVANSDDGNGAKLQSADNSWATFGDITKTKQAVIGFAIASNMLYLNEGIRTVTITFQCNNNVPATITANDFNKKCNIQFTGKKNWFDPSTFDKESIVTCDHITANSFSLSIIIPGNAPAVIPYSPKIHGGNFTEALPMLQLQLTDYAGYAAIKKLEIISITVAVDVKGVKDIVLQNDDGKIDAAKPFKLFGEFPEQNASLIIGSKEIFQKNLDSLTIHFTWQIPSKAAITKTVSAPKMQAQMESDSLLLRKFTQEQISEPFITQSSASVSAAEIEYLSAGEWSSLGNTGKSIEALSQSSSPITLTKPNLPGESILPAAVDFAANEEYKTTSVDGFLKIQLNDNSFNLSTYLYNVNQSVAQTSVTITGTTTLTYTMNPPPVVQLPNAPAATAVTIDYLASKTFSLSSDISARTDFFYHIEPFGFREIQAALTNDKLTVLPFFNLDDGISSDNGGELWIGLNNAAAQETFTILFQVADGTSNPLKQMTTINWYYLSKNNWLPFDPIKITDQSNNFTRSGIVTLNIAIDATTTNTRTDSGLIWIKAVVNHDTDAVCKLIAVTTNAAKATFLQDISKDIVFTKTLSSNTISKAAVADAALKKINQPYPSFDGRTAETENQFYVRVSERLRHKHRAVTAWDYERLILQNYPQVHKVKCINHTGLITDKSNNQKYSETLPGHVTIVTIPDLTNNITANPLRPYTSIGLLTEIQKYIQQLTSPFVVSNLDDPTLNRLHVINPQFEEVQFNFSVMFLPDYDETFFINQLNTDIEQFLTPWAFDTGTDIEFGGTLKKSAVLNFIEERDYVDYVTCFKMNQIISRNGTTILQMLPDVEEAVATTARSILVSYNDGVTRHIIHSQSNCDCNA
jgi:hypothetical protein